MSALAQGFLNVGIASVVLVGAAVERFMERRNRW